MTEIQSVKQKITNFQKNLDCCIKRRYATGGPEEPSNKTDDRGLRKLKKEKDSDLNSPLLTGRLDLLRHPSHGATIHRVIGTESTERYLSCDIQGHCEQSIHCNYTTPDNRQSG